MAGFLGGLALIIWAMVTGTRGPWIHAVVGAVGAFGVLAIALGLLVALRTARQRLAARIRRGRYIRGADRGKWDFIVNTHRAEEEVGSFGLELLKELFRIQRLIEQWAPKMAAINKHSTGRIATILKHRDLGVISKKMIARAENVDRILIGLRGGIAMLFESAAGFIEVARVSRRGTFPRNAR